MISLFPRNESRVQLGSNQTLLSTISPYKMVIAPLFNHHTCAIFLHNTTDFINRFVKKFFDTFHIFWFNRKHETNTHVEDFKHFFVFDFTIFSRALKIGRTGTLLSSISAAKSSENIRGTFSMKPPPVMWAIPFNQFFFDEWQSRFDVDTSWFKKNVFKFFCLQVLGELLHLCNPQIHDARVSNRLSGYRLRQVQEAHHLQPLLNRQ